MKKIALNIFSNPSRATLTLTSIFGLVFIFTAFANITAAQSNQLMLADIVIALRSKKVTLSDRNKIIADAVLVRGVTFSLTPEIEKELEDTGADKNLIESIKQKSHIVKTSAVVTPTVETKPKTEPVAPAPPDFSFYEKRADVSFSKNDLDAAFTDYNKAIEMNPKAPGSLLGRGLVYEKRGNLDLAAGDYGKALEIEPANAAAKAYNDRVAEAQERAKPKSDPIAAQTVAAPVVIPDVIDLGLLTKELAIRIAVPVYPKEAASIKIGGRVVVDITFDTDGKVTSAKASSGSRYLKQNSEDAAKRSIFKPAMFGTQAVKGKGYIVYNFTPPQ